MSESMKIHNSTIGVLKEDITLLEVQAFVFYASHDLKLGSGFGTAISMRGGSSIQEELDALAPVETTQVVITGAGKLPSDFILHAVGPRIQILHRAHQTSQKSRRLFRKAGRPRRIADQDEGIDRLNRQWEVVPRIIKPDILWGYLRKELVSIAGSPKSLTGR